MDEPHLTLSVTLGPSWILNCLMQPPKWPFSLGPCVCCSIHYLSKVQTPSPDEEQYICTHAYMYACMYVLNGATLLCIQQVTKSDHAAPPPPHTHTLSWLKLSVLSVLHSDTRTVPQYRPPPLFTSSPINDSYPWNLIQLNTSMQCISFPIYLIFPATLSPWNRLTDMKTRKPSWSRTNGLQWTGGLRDPLTCRVMLMGA
jgi:hypothetical protein